MAKAAASNSVLIPASIVAEQLALNNSSTVFVYDLATEAGFGALTLECGKEGHNDVLAMQTRAGAGLNLVGRLSEDERANVQKDSIFTAYNTPEGVAAMATSFFSLPEPSARSRLILQVPTITVTGQDLEISPTIAPLNAVFNALPTSFAVLLSSTPQELVDFASLSYMLPDYHVIHLLDQYSAGRELGHTLTRHDGDAQEKHTKPREALRSLGYDFFEYVGREAATDIYIIPNGPLASVAKTFVKRSPHLGLIVVRVLKPWDEALLLSILPDSARKVYVLDEVQSEASQGYLYAEVFSALLASAKSSRNSVKSIKLVPALTQHFVKSPSSFAEYLTSLLAQPPLLQDETPTDASKKSLLFFGSPSTALENVPIEVISSFGKTGISARCIVDYDVLSKSGGITATRAVVVLDDFEYTPIFVEQPLGNGQRADFIAVLDQNLIKTHSLLDSAKIGSVILLFSRWSASEVSSNLPSEAVRLLRQKELKLYNFNVNSVGDDGGSEAIGICAYLAFFRLYLGTSANEIVLRKLAHAAYADVGESVRIDKLNAKAWSILEEVDLASANEEEGQSELKSFSFNAIRPTSVANHVSLPGAYLSSWHEAARHILFPDAFESPETSTSTKQDPSLHPEIPDNTFLVTCTVNRRLTPLEYDRNVFHMEFDTSGTGLKYEIGEALGVHGWNDDREVLDFCTWYGVDKSRLITIPVPGADGRLHTRTVFQALQQQIDLFGKPPKSFYSALADYATEKVDKLTLQFIGSAEGSSTFKKLSEKDTATFADILQKYPSARPPIETLCEIIGDIKPRHYSIASAQSVVGDRVDLLVVTVKWLTPSGSPRYGQCTRYLAGLKVGQKVTVSIKPSVMKLPPDNMQPLILAGLGTGAAPFRAFLQHRAMLVSQGKPVGPLYYYFGSRYRSKEYLYGEEIEAFILDKTITRAGLAFSRDGKKKVYIQHIMSEDAETLARMLRNDNGVFYLCGPTWPVPDVYEALVGALVKYLGMEEKEAGDYLEGLKEEERYVLEVY